jgi:hypothetical protein
MTIRMKAVEGLDVQGCANRPLPEETNPKTTNLKTKGRDSIVSDAALQLSALRVR